MSYIPGKRLRRFWLRALACTLVPPAVTAFYAVIVFYWLGEQKQDASTEYGPKGARYVYYAWFVIGVFGLSVSEYGLAGAEASMLMHPSWKCRNAQEIMMQCDKTWSGPGGWARTLNIIRAIWRRKKQRPHSGAQFPRTWVALSIPSFLCYLGLALSGLSLELASGYVAGDGTPTVVGFNDTTFGLATNSIRDRATAGWTSARSERPPRRGVIYRRQGTTDYRFPVTRSFPNVLSLDSVPDIFLGPQSDGPVSGKMYGVMANYNCSIVTSLNDFTILNHRNKSLQADYAPATDIENTGFNYAPPRSRNQVIFLIDEQFRSFRNSIQSVIEVGTDYNSTFLEKGPGMKHNNDCTKPTAGPSDFAPGGRCEGPGITHVLEVILWQCVGDVLAKILARIGGSGDRNITVDDIYEVNSQGYRYKFDPLLRYIGPTIPELKNAHYNTDPTRHNSIRGWEDYRNLSDAKKGVPMVAIGVRCTSSTAAGFADVNGLQGTFKDFKPSGQVYDGYPNNITETDSDQPTGNPSLVYRVWQVLLSSYFNWKANSDAYAKPTPFEGIYQSVLGETSVVAGFPPIQGRQDIVQLAGHSSTGYDYSSARALTAAQLRQSLIQAFASSAMALMFRGSDERSVTGEEETEIFGKMGWQSSNLREATQASILVPGNINPLLVLVLLALWSLCNVVVGLCFAFRRRWAETLDGYSLFRFGAEAATRYGLMHQFCAVDYQHSPELQNIPGLIGDLKPNEHPGFITLVDNTVAVKHKLYR